MKTGVALAVVLTCLLVVPTWRADGIPHQGKASAQFSEQGVASLSLELTEGKVVRVVAKATSSLHCLSEYQSLWSAPMVWLGWGADTMSPKDLVNSLEVTVDGKPAILAMSAYVDLGNPHSITLEAAPNGFTLTLLGGESSTAYKAVLQFKGIYLESRRVELRAMSKSAWESTSYSWPADGAR